MTYTPKCRYKKRKRKSAASDSVDEEENDEDSTISSDEEMAQFPSDSEEEQDSSDREDNEEEVQSRTLNSPTIIRRREWISSNERALDSFSSVHGDNLFYTNHWNGFRGLTWDTGMALENAQRSLTAAAKIVDRHSITLEYKSKPKCLSQIPYRKFHFGSPFCTFYVTRD